jgi:hypothetical protein
MTVAVEGIFGVAWDAAGEVPSTFGVSWDTGFFGGTFGVSWDMGGPVPGTFGLAWDILDGQVSVTGTFGVSWEILRIDQICRAYWAQNEDVGFWKGFADKSAVMSRGPLVNDVHGRYYIVQDDDVPRYTTFKVLELERRRDAQQAAGAYYRLGIPRPRRAPLVTVAGGTVDLTVDRAYVYTWVSSLGEEGPPSNPYNVSGPDDGVWTVTGFDVDVPNAGERLVSTLRVYRTVTGNLGNVDYHFIADIPFDQTTFADDVSTTIVGSNTVLESADWFPPPPDLRGLVEHPNGFFIGFVGRDIYMSEPYRPHAWPPDYVVSTIGDVVGFGVFGTSVVVCTENFPYTLTGTHPSVMTFTQHDTAEPCQSRYGIVSMPQGVYFPGPNGLVMRGPRGFDTITETLITKEEWESRYNPSAIDAARYQNSYVAFYSDEEGFLFTPTDPLYTFVELNRYWSNCGIQTDEYSGRVIMCTGQDLYEWNPSTGANATYVWESKEFDVADPKNFGAFRIIHYGDPVPTDAEIAAWRAYNLIRIADPLGPVNWGAIGAAKKVVPDVTDPTPENRQAVAGPVLYPVPPVGQPWPDQGTLTAEFFANGVLVHTKAVTSTDMFRLPSGFKKTLWKIRLTGERKVKSVKMAETGRELRTV